MKEMVLQEKTFKREAAKKVSVADILAGNFAESSEGLVANIKGAPVKKANLLATIVDKAESENFTYKSIVVDDGTGQVQLRFFGSDEKEESLFKRHEIGDFIIVIGRLRQYGNQPYLSPEIIKKIENTNWAEVRRLELKTEPQAVLIAEAESKTATRQDLVNKEKMDIYQLVRQLDAGKGAEISEVVKAAKGTNPEAAVREMIKSGDLFEASPGKLKVLE
ncbi:hypothetical protein HYU18_03900 [Candidatus Woesearchaeota archaeon]|nr:hypothetical protein [Candidatus Woesearchaeota archaeon]